MLHVTIYPLSIYSLTVKARTRFPKEMMNIIQTELSATPRTKHKTTNIHQTTGLERSAVSSPNHVFQTLRPK